MYIIEGQEMYSEWVPYIYTSSSRDKLHFPERNKMEKI